MAQSLKKQQIDKLVEQARRAEQGGDYPRAANLYTELAHWEEQYVYSVTDPKAKDSWRQHAGTHRTYADRLRRGSPPPPAGDQQRIAASPEDAATGGDVGAMLAIIDGLIVPNSPVRWDDIVGLEEAKREVKMAFALAAVPRPANVRLPTWERILFYGPSGTGKTLLASAVAGSIHGATFFNAQRSQLTSKWYGETSKLMTLLFQRAREKAPSVVFLDEVDELAGRRDDSGRHEATISSLNTLLQEVSGLRDLIDQRFVLTFAATNRPWALDDAFLSRFAKAIYISLPDGDARQAMFQIHTEKQGIRVDVPYQELAAMTDLYSGREIATLCTQAVMTMVLDQNPNLLGMVDQGMAALSTYSMNLRPLSRQDFQQAHKSIHPLASEGMLQTFESWRKEKGF